MLYEMGMANKGEGTSWKRVIDTRFPCGARVRLPIYEVFQLHP